MKKPLLCAGAAAAGYLAARGRSGRPNRDEFTVEDDILGALADQPYIDFAPKTAIQSVMRKGYVKFVGKGADGFDEYELTRRGRDRARFLFGDQVFFEERYPRHGLAARGRRGWEYQGANLPEQTVRVRWSDPFGTGGQYTFGELEGVGEHLAGALEGAHARPRRKGSSARGRSNPANRIATIIEYIATKAVKKADTFSRWGRVDEGYSTQLGAIDQKAMRIKYPSAVTAKHRKEIIDTLRERGFTVRINTQTSAAGRESFYSLTVFAPSPAGGSSARRLSGYTYYVVDRKTGKVLQGARGSAGEEDLWIWIQEVADSPKGLAVWTRKGVLDKFGQIKWASKKRQQGASWKP